MLLRECVLFGLEDGRPTTSRRIARRFGADRVAVDGVLRDLMKAGRVAVHHPAGDEREPIYRKVAIP